MDHEWLLVETLGTEPVVVAEGRQMTDMVPIAAYLRKTPDLAAIQTAIAETVATGDSLASITPKARRVIRTEPVQMSDGRVHGVHVWTGPVGAEPPERPTPGPLKWDLTAGIATDTVESLTNAGMDPAEESVSGRAFAEDMPSRDLDTEQARVLALTIDAEPGQTYCTTWSITDKQGRPRQVGFVARTALETVEDGTEHLVTRAMNLEAELHATAEHTSEGGANRTTPTTTPATTTPATTAADSDQSIAGALDSETPPGVYRALVDLKNWHLLKWMTEPCPYYDWHSEAPCHPDDVDQLTPMTTEFGDGAASRVLRLPGNDGGWVPIHVTVDRVEVDRGVYAGIITLRLPNPDELKLAIPEGAA